MNESLLDPEILYDVASKIENLKVISDVDCIYGYWMEDRVIASAVSILSKKPFITDELFKKCDVNQLEESFSVLIIVVEIKTLKNLIRKIKKIRNLGFEVNTLISLNRVIPEIESEFRMMGVKIINVK